MRPKVALIGHFPPPIGGVAIHLIRLYHALHQYRIEADALSFNTDRQENIFPIKKNPFFFAKRLLKGYTVLHYHTDETDWKSAVAFAIWCKVRRQKLIFSVHTFRELSLFKSFFVRKLILWAYNQAVFIIGISEHVIHGIEEYLDGKLHTPYKIITPFLPLSETELASTIHTTTEQFLSQHKINICFNASGLMLYNNIDIYGADILLDAFECVSRKYPYVGLTMFYAREGRGEYWKKIVEQSAKFRRNVHLTVQENTFFAPILVRSQIFVRPTFSDGSSISVMEALSLQKWCIASDAVPRPNGCVLFKNRNVDDLQSVLEKTIQKVLNGESPRNPPQESGLEDIISVYKQFS